MVKGGYEPLRGGGVRLPSSGHCPSSGAGRDGSFGAGGSVGVPWFAASGSSVPWGAMLKSWGDHTPGGKDGSLGRSSG